MRRREYSTTDETCYCANCGISFLWSAEEQHQAEQQQTEQQIGADDLRTGRPPQYCPGCRHLLPQSGRARGLVKWYHRRKGYGFITRYGQPDIYVHRAAVHKGRLAPDDLVSFIYGENEQGPIAEDVEILETGSHV
ncbi:MAG: cold shock domain-containing protein [Caldilineaceae bacterium]